MLPYSDIISLSLEWIPWRNIYYDYEYEYGHLYLLRPIAAFNSIWYANLLNIFSVSLDTLYYIAYQIYCHTFPCKFCKRPATCIYLKKIPKQQVWKVSKGTWNPSPTLGQTNHF